jgi:hypothetical protein
MNRQYIQTLQSVSSADFDRHWLTFISGPPMSAIMMTGTAMAGSSSHGAKQLEEQRAEQLEGLGELNTLWGQPTRLLGRPPGSRRPLRPSLWARDIPTSHCTCG